MPTLSDFFSDPQGVRFKNEVGGWPLDFEAVLLTLDEPAVQARMVAASGRGRPALAGAVVKIEARPDVAAYLAGTDSHQTVRFRQAVGIAVKIAMDHLGWRTTGRKGSLGKRAGVAAGTTTPGASINDPPDPSRYFSKAEIYEPASGEEGSAAQHDRLADDQVANQRRLEMLRAGLDQIASIGTPEEQAETLDVLMNALAETRRAEGRVF